MKARIFRTIRNKSYELTAKSKGKNLVMYGQGHKYDKPPAA